MSYNNWYSAEVAVIVLPPGGIAGAWCMSLTLLTPWLAIPLVAILFAAWLAGALAVGAGNPYHKSEPRVETASYGAFHL